ncbi:MAG: DUF885 domain-containing protein [Thermoanaerobaculia bacterium]|nr:DUF885 domain-containing protein [Thermoanaerobaculia bacterium]
MLCHRSRLESWVLLFLAVSVVGLPHVGSAAPSPSDAERFESLLADHWAASVEERIYFRNDPDGWRMEGRLSEHTAEARARRRDFNLEVLKRLEAIDPEQLDPRDRVSYEVFRYERETERDSYSQFDHFFPFTSLFGYHTYFAEAPANMSFLSAADYDRYLVSLEDFPRYNREHIANLREAVRGGYTQYCDSLKDYEETISIHVVDNPEDSLLYGPFEKFPGLFTEDQKSSYRRRGSTVIADKVVPAFAQLLTFYTDEYVPACRREVGISSVEGGSEYYQYLIRYFTTTDMTAREIHELGLAEVARIRGEMSSILTEVGFEGTFQEFLDFLRKAPEFYAKTELELLGRAALISKTAEGELPKFFGLLPRGTYKVSPNPSRGTYYVASAGDGKTSGTYFVGTESLEAQPFYTLEALTLHEGVPGHHLQSALALEVGLPDFRRTLYHSAYGEGWGLYSERLGQEMGFYQDPYSNFGRLTYEIWRACRLVVDTGMHAFGWSRQRALDYLLSNAALSDLEAKREIDRYITWPAQALSYKIGELKIRELRATAERELGADFDLRAFHDAVLANGSLPIAVLESQIATWIESQKPSEE